MLRIGRCVVKLGESVDFRNYHLTTKCKSKHRLQLVKIQVDKHGLCGLLQYCELLYKNAGHIRPVEKTFNSLVESLPADSITTLVC